jgi:hypothetical protein
MENNRMAVQGTTTRPNPRGGVTQEQRTPVDRDELRRNSEYVGDVGSEVELDVRVNHITGPFESQYGGERYKYLLGDEGRNAINCWGGRTFKGPGGLSITPTKGDRFKVRAEVAKHETFREEKQTVLKNLVIIAGL